MQSFFTLLPESSIAGGRNLINQIAVEFYRQRCSEGQPRHHAGGISGNRLVHIRTELCEVLHEVENLLDIILIDPSNEPDIVGSRQGSVKGRNIAQRSGCGHRLVDASRRGMLHPREQAHQR